SHVQYISAPVSTGAYFLLFLPVTLSAAAESKGTRNPNLITRNLTLMPSFDIASSVDLQVLDNAINTVKKEIA
ncbi:DUF520 family protein, partial [Pseudoalteromonas piscicida]